MKYFLLVFLSFSLSAQELNHGNFGKFSRSLNNKEYAYKVVDDPTGKAPSKKVELFELRFGDCTKNISWDDCKTDRERVELIQSEIQKLNEQTFWYSWSFYLNESFENVWPVKLSVAQFYDDQADKPLWMFQISDKGLSVENFLDKSQNILINASDLKQKWQNIQLEIKWTSKKDGKFNVWVNGQNKLTYTGPTFATDKIFFKYGLYRSFLKRWTKSTPIPTQTIYFSNVKMGKTQKNILP